MSDFFHETFGFAEHHRDYDKNQAQLASIAFFEADNIVQGWQRCNFRAPLKEEGPVRAGIFRFDNVAELRVIAFKLLLDAGYSSVEFAKSHAEGDSRALHQKYPNALFQAASQFNCLEFVSPNVTPEFGITMYINDRTQGPACAIACAAATAFRNYLVPVTDSLTCGNAQLPVPAFASETQASQFGQRAGKQLNGLAELEPLVFREFGGKRLWQVQNGYIELTADGAAAGGAFVQRSKDAAWEQGLIDTLRVGCNFESEVTDVRIGGHKPAGYDTKDPVCVSQVFASACSIGYSDHNEQAWEPLARIVLKAAYEATFYAYIIHVCRCELMQKKPDMLLLTKLGGGVFANPAAWIQDAMLHAQKRVELLFQELRAQPPAMQRAPSSSASSSSGNEEATAIAKKRAPFMFRAAVTHFRGTEPGYDKFIGTRTMYPTAEAAAEDMMRVPSFKASLEPKAGQPTLHASAGGRVAPSAASAAASAEKQ